MSFDKYNHKKVETKIYSYWEKNNLFKPKKNKRAFSIVIPPPNVTGSLHMGHALNKVLKDIINKFHILQGKKVRYLPGWDCHGLPIELKVLQKLSQKEREELTPLKLRKNAAAYALQ